MDFSEFRIAKQETEKYFANIIKSRFQTYVAENFELDISVDYMTHALINDLLKGDGFEVFGMNANMDEFKLLLDFDHPYLRIENFPFSRISVSLKNDGNYSVYLGENSFEDDWHIDFEDDFHRHHMMSKEELQNILKEMKDVHLMLLLKKGY